MLTTVARRDEQALGALGPRLLTIVETIRAELGLQPGEVVGDVLLACGMGVEPTPDHVAACSSRFAQQAHQPDAVVLVGEQTSRLASRAGLLAQNLWQPQGAPAGVPVFEVPEHDLPRKVVRLLAAALGRRYSPRVPPAGRALLGQEQVLLGALGRARGMAIKGRHEGHWKRHRFARLSAAHIRDHFDGRCWVSPFHARGAWPFVVVDIDRHNALQEAEFGSTLARVRKAFPNSLVMRSSASGGAHIYVKLPPGTKYEDGALWLQVYLANLRLLYLDRTIRVTDPMTLEAKGAPLRALRVEVPDQPVRLPFGLGSHIWGSSKSITAQFGDFITFVTSAPADDFEAARKHVLAALELSDKWDEAKRKRLRRYLLEAETKKLPLPALPPQDPWAPLISSLPQGLKKIAVGGIPAHGTRTRWTLALIEALGDLVPPDQTRKLLDHWLVERDHQSQDIELNLEHIQTFTAKEVKRHARHVAGVPERAWACIEASVRAAYQASTTGLPFTVDELLRTAFFIARRFYSLRKQSRRVSRWEFRAFTGANTASLVRDLLAGGGAWLLFEASYVIGQRATTYRLHDDLWPLRPGDPIRHVP